MADTVRIEVLLDVKPRLGEGPVWDVQEQCLYFIDSLGDRLYRCRADGSGLATWELPGHIGSMALREQGGALLALQDGFHLFDFDSHRSTLLVNPEPELTGNRLNDGTVDRQGRFVCGSMDTNEAEPTGKLWCLHADHRLNQLDQGIICTNGTAFSPDGRTFYFSDSFKGCIYACDYDTDSGTVHDKRIFVRPEAREGGAPDGATVDSDGCLWCVLVFDGRLMRFTPEGRLDRTIEMPVVKTTSLNFGGPNLDILYVTSMAHPPLPRYPSDGPLRGSLFAITGLGVQGLAEPRYKG